MTPAREALALGMPPETTAMEMVKAVKGRLSNFKPIPPREVSIAPWLENTDRGAKVNLLKFPVPSGMRMTVVDISGPLMLLSAETRTPGM